MRDNGPVTQTEYSFPAGQTLVSTTDLKGRILYCNPAFIEVSGYDRSELLGQPHSMIRHPDMPEEAFRDMWDSIQHGRPWSALVKNRRKNGDHYWVKANVTPLMQGDQAVGYMSVRTCPDRRDVEAAEALYGDMRRREREGAPAAVRLQRGRPRHSGIRGWLQRAGETLVALRFAGLTIGLAVGSYLLASAWEHAWTGAAVAAGLGLAACLYLQGRLHGPLKDLLSFADRMAAGDLTQRLTPQGSDAVGQLAIALNQLNVNLQSVVGDAREEAVLIQHAVSEIAAGNQEMSSRTESQAGSLEETASSMEQITGTVRSGADASARAARLATDTAGEVDAGAKSMGEVTATMHAISESSRRIADITQVIDSISFQTNILALNAAVEAARAGEQGRGFAVVAAEVRALAQRTTSAAKEIRALIDASQLKVDHGVTQAEQAASIIAASSTKVSEVAALIREISQGAQEQLGGISQINAAVSHLDGITQQNAAMVEELAASADALRQRAEVLTESVRVFTTETSQASATDAVTLRKAMRAQREATAA